MDASDRIAEEFNRLCALGPATLADRTWSEQVVYYVVGARCENDMSGFESIYEQFLRTASELRILIDGLDRIGERKLAAEFRQCLELLEADGFYEHMNWNRVSDSVKQTIEAIGARVGDTLWDVDDKLVSLLDGAE